MAFTTQRGRPRSTAPVTDAGTPELRLKHALGLTAEPIDLCLEKKLIAPEHHWSGLHLRWLYTLRYGAPNLTTRYADREAPSAAATEDPAWRAMREREYHAATELLTSNARYECVMRLAVFNELPAFLSVTLRERAWNDEAIAERLMRQHHQLREGLGLLAHHWRRSPSAH